ncbi:MAG: hypothetical protein CL927_02125 [Deltaproteobacteria bacterium]|nr:hypothetical protein [Deltaproteobacteria bacterium]
MSPSLKPGNRVDRYRVELTLGEGGLATVYRVRHEVLGTVHALKVLHVHGDRIRERLLAEGRAQAQLAHPHIASVTDVLDVGGAPALLMEFVDGGTLADVVADAPLPLEATLRLFRGVVTGVVAAHEAGIVHRDLKPDNILLALPDDDAWHDAAPDWSRVTPKVTDFGLAKVLDPVAGSPGQHTEAGVAMGTPAFMAPEQIRDARTVDHRADIFSLGAVLHALLTGRSPFAGADRFAVLQNVATGTRPPVESLRTDLPKALVQLLDRCLHVDPTMRFATATTLLDALDQLQPARMLESPPTGPHETPSHPARAPLSADRLPPPSPTPPSAMGGRTATVAGLVVDPSGRGHVVELVVVLTPGGSGVRTSGDVDRDADVAAQLAVAVALGPDTDAFGVRWAARGVGFTIHGTSLGLAIAVATRAAFMGRPAPSNWAFTGGIDLDGRVVSVHGVPAKVRAALAAGRVHIAVPQVDRAGLSAEPATLHGIAQFAELAAQLFPSRRRAVPWRWGLLALPAALAITDATSVFDTWIQHPVLSATRGVVEMDDVRLVRVPYSPTLQKRRAEYPDLLRNLSQGGATGVFFDIALSSESPHDSAIASAIEEASAAGMPVGIPVRLQHEQPVLPGSVAIRDAATLGIVEARQDAVFLQVRSLPTRLQDLEGNTWWHLAVWSAAAHVHARTPPSLVKQELRVGPLRNPTFAEELVLPPLGPVESIDIEDVSEAAAAGRFDGKSVVVGVVGAPNDSHRLPSGVRSGAEIEAGAVQVLIRQAGVARLAPEWDALFATLLGIGTVLLGQLTRPRIWVAALVPVAGSAVFVALASANQVLAPGPAIVAVLMALLVLRRPHRRAPGGAASPHIARQKQ